MVRQMDIFIQYAVAAADMAFAQAGLGDDPRSDRIGCYVGWGWAVSIIEATLASLAERPPARDQPVLHPVGDHQSGAGTISLRHKCRGPNMSMVSACSTGAHSLGEAARVIERGDADS